MSNAIQKLPHSALIPEDTAYQKCHALRITLKQLVSTLPVKPLAHAKILKYSTKLLALNAEAKGTTAKLELTLKTQVGEKKNMLNCPIVAVFKFAKDTGCRTKRQRQRNSVFDENFPTPKKPHQRNSPKVRNRKR